MNFSLPDSLMQEMESQHKSRESALASCRLIIQSSSKCIRHVHRKQFDIATTLLQEAKLRASEQRKALKVHPRLEYAGYLQDAEKEMVEAAVVLAIVQRQEIPSKADLDVDLVSYLNGLGEAASELRRTVLDEMRTGSLEEATRMLHWMESIYDELITFDFPDSLTGGLRRTCDALRAVVERTRSDLTLTLSQRELLDALKRQ